MLAGTYAKLGLKDGGYWKHQDIYVAIKILIISKLIT
jgi:hypothetical protein